jgi:hypothetical protein
MDVREDMSSLPDMSSVPISADVPGLSSLPGRARLLELCSSGPGIRGPAGTARGDEGHGRGGRLLLEEV